MSVNNKRYQASFYQQPAAIDTVAFRKKLQSNLLSKYTEEELANLTEEKLSELLKLDIMMYEIERFNRSVWFMIAESYGEYYILMYYDNKYNEANGEDL